MNIHQYAQALSQKTNIPLETVQKAIAPSMNSMLNGLILSQYTQLTALEIRDISRQIKKDHDDQ